ncbi:hypothetical protein [Jannaschia ovalis]|uniref:Lipoprotein n=1 Tax=Jannaschia ovalis TaxID=3038773 RepID=A0ABY8L6X5_9RHOB|nr:hypothetical protein [Jannaschia sp. GRR-S6-38]WGH77139.1 hypothetical protein P8627_08685 [Jannaschia sp. GRR-S6-38]
MLRFSLLALCLALPACGQDKAKHAAAGVVTSQAVAEMTGSQVKGCMAAIGLGLAKEAWDSTGRGTADGDDLLATSVGCGFVIEF